MVRTASVPAHAHRAQPSISRLSEHTPNDRGFSLGQRRAFPVRWSRSGKANVEDEVSEPQIQGSAAGPVDDECEQDDDQDDDHQPEEEHDDRGNCVPAYGSGSSHRLQLPGAARIIRNGR
jgi:hypothetical protein